MNKPDSISNDRPRIPSMEKILSSGSVCRVSETWGRDNVKEVIREILDEVRGAGAAPREVSVEGIAEEADARLSAALRPSLRRVINGAGVIIHTNLGRSPIDPDTWARAAGLVTRYGNLEFDLATGARGKRHLHVSALASKLFGCEAALLVNNNAAAVLLVLAALANGKEVIVSRGELVEIGGSFRVPDVIQQGGAKLREVGTTNRTRAADYEAAAGRKTGALLQVHQSNFQIVGFTEAPKIEDLANVARKKKVPLVVDEGSGRVVDLQRYGFRAEPTIRELFEAGADVVTCSTDKLIGSVQGGLILGSKKHLERCAAHPLMRAFRPGKESFAMVGGTLLAHLRGASEREIPVYRMLSADSGGLRARAEKLAAECGLRVTATQCALGGGTTPEETIPSIGVHVPGNAAEVHGRFLSCSTPVVGRIVGDRFLIDLRTVLPEEDEELAAMIAEART